MLVPKQSSTTSVEVTLVSKREPSGSGAWQSDTEFDALDRDRHDHDYARIGWTALGYAAAYAAAFLSGLAIEGSGSATSQTRKFDYVLAAASVLFGIAVFAICRRRLVPPERLCGFAFFVLVAGAIGINLGFWGTEAFFSGSPEIIGIPWVCVWILLIPAMLPTAPRRALAAGIFSAVTGPVILILSSVAHLGAGAWTNALAVSVQLFYPAFICAGIAYWMSLLLYRLSRDASRARRMGSYQLVDKIGSGGMGEVWRAKHRLLVRPAAIKLIRPSVLGAGAEAQRTLVRRFEREAQATAALRSPHTIEIYDFGLAEDGTFYYVMELLEGFDLKRLVEKHGPLLEARAVHILRQACHSLYDAHASGMVHRDVKPANIFTCRRGQEFDYVKVLDFGLVAGREQVDFAGTQLTQEGMMTGTPAFMAPEMVYGQRAVDPRADIYALGCVGYWLLTGGLVFEGPTPVAVLIMHTQEKPLPPSKRTDNPIDAELERILLQCLEKDPDRRPATARELADRLEACATRLGRWDDERASGWWRDHAPEHFGARSSDQTATSLAP